jgi:hypothetical protein
LFFSPIEIKQALTHQSDICYVLAHLSHWTKENLETVHPSHLLPTQPQTASTSKDPQFSFPKTKIADPLPPHFAHWIFALLLILDAQLTGEQISHLRELARAAMRVGAWRWIKAVTDGEIADAEADTATSASTSEGAQSRHLVLDSRTGKEWSLGAHRKATQHATHASSPGLLVDNTNLDETLARCWTIVWAVAAGWAQWDLVDELHGLFT